MFNACTHYIIIGTQARKDFPSEGYIFTDNVEILTKADEKSTVLGTLKSHDTVEILFEVEIKNRNGVYPWWELY